MDLKMFLLIVILIIGIALIGVGIYYTIAYKDYTSTSTTERTKYLTKVWVGWILGLGAGGVLTLGAGVYLIYMIMSRPKTPTPEPIYQPGVGAFNQPGVGAFNQPQAQQYAQLAPPPQL